MRIDEMAVDKLALDEMARCQFQGSDVPFSWFCSCSSLSFLLRSNLKAGYGRCFLLAPLSLLSHFSTLSLLFLSRFSFSSLSLSLSLTLSTHTNTLYSFHTCTHTHDDFLFLLSHHIRISLLFSLSCLLTNSVSCHLHILLLKIYLIF